MMKNFPHFLVIGAGKSGTTSLHEYLRQNPGISLPIQKETHYFVSMEEGEGFDNPYLGRDLTGYIASERDYMSSFEMKDTSTIFGEICPSYLYYPKVPQNILNVNPNVKIIAVLRNPVDRFLSNIKYYSSKNGKDYLNNVSDVIKLAESDINIYRMLFIGQYSVHLARFFNIFHRHQIRIYLFEDLETQPHELMADLTRFIQAPSFDYNTKKKFNVSGSPRNPWLYQKLFGRSYNQTMRKLLNPKIYQVLRPVVESLFMKNTDPPLEIDSSLLKEYYRKGILDLQDLINRDLSAWMK